MASDAGRHGTKRNEKRMVTPGSLCKGREANGSSNGSSNEQLSEADGALGVSDAGSRISLVGSVILIASIDGHIPGIPAGPLSREKCVPGDFVTLGRIHLDTLFCIADLALVVPCRTLVHRRSFIHFLFPVVIRRSFAAAHRFEGIDFASFIHSGRFDSNSSTLTTHHTPSQLRRGTHQALLALNHITASALATSILPRPQALESFRRPSILQVLDLPAFKTASTFDDKTLPSIGLEISRPSSTSTVASFPPRHGSHASIQLPALSALHQENGEGRDHAMRAVSPQKMSPPLSKLSNGHSMTYATAAPAMSGGPSNATPVCQNCTTSRTPLWRRDESGSVLCNACGLFLKLHGRPRPISLKTDVIKSRNRVKTGGSGRKKAGETNGLPAAHPDADPALALAQHRRASGKLSSGLSDRSQSPISRTGTPGISHSANIAPQHMFDGALQSDPFHSPSIPPFHFRHPSPGSTSSVNGSHLEPPLSYDALTAQNTSLRTRVSELEVINDLFRGRVTELETSEQEARRVEAAARETETQLRAELEEIRQREAELKRRLEEIEGEGPRHKKMRLSDLVDDSQAGTPISSTSD